MRTAKTLGLLAGFALAIASVPGFAAPQSGTYQTTTASVAAAIEAPQTNAKQAQGDYEELTQGPVHEAFAEPVVFDPEPGIVVPKAPPDPIKEAAPKQKPNGAGLTWISGYWGWDPEQKDFLWVSGIWRVPPPDQKWKPGSWEKTDGGYQWISGFWHSTTADAQAVSAKLPKPPKSLEKGPSSPTPDDQHVWIPGYWDYRGSEYAWSAGYWTPGYADRVYIPSHHVWQRDGYFRVGGYWDYPVASRGFLFAPVHFRSPVYARVGFSFTPGLVINTGFLLDNIFAYSGYGHYYFGNYYDSAYVGFGIYPAYSRMFLAIGFSDIWEHHWWDHRRHHHDNDWDHHRYRSYREAYQHERQERYDRLRDNAAERPGRTLQQDASRIAGAKEGVRGELAARRFKDVLADKAFVGEFAKQSRQSAASARQATLAERKNLHPGVQQGEVSKSDLERNQQGRGSERSAVVKSDKAGDKGKDSRIRDSSRSADSPSSVRRTNDNDGNNNRSGARERSGRTEKRSRSNDDRKSGKGRHGNR